MKSYSKSERLLSSMLSSFPFIKRIIKHTYIYGNSLIYKKKYSNKILENRITLHQPFQNLNKESFFGYYDKKSLNNQGLLISHFSSRNTKKKPNTDELIEISITNIQTGKTEIIGTSSTYTWQQGTRAQWLSDDLIIYNDFREDKYQAIVYSISTQKVVKTFNYPVQDSFKTDYYLSINYRRIMNLRPDYGYRNLPLLTEKEMKDTQNDGIWLVDYTTQEVTLLHSLLNIINCEPNNLFTSCLHKVNHLMISKNGKGFIFIHRYYQGKRRFDRLMYSDFKTLKVLVDDNMVSHCCWIDDNNILGYFRYNGINGYYYCNIYTKEITPCHAMTNLMLGDGHPSCCGNWIVFDSYPDKSRMQHLLLYNQKSKQVIPLLELFQSIDYMNESRCDLHPRFSEDGRYVFFDTVFTGKRTQCYIDLKGIE